jgi:hypothetical protein
MKDLNEMDVPCCTIKDKEAIHEDETIIYAENAKVLKVPAQEETVSCPPPLDFDDPCFMMKEMRRRRMNYQMIQTLHVMTWIMTLLITLMSSYMLGDVGGI